MVPSDDKLPIGFLGPVKGWASLLPSGQHTLRLPRDQQHWQDLDGPPLDLIEVNALTESLGRIEQAFAVLASRLRDGGSLLCDIDNVQSARMLRMVIEGHPGGFDPAGSSRDPSQALPLRRVLEAIAAQDLLVRDVIAVPGGVHEFGDGFARQLMGSGLLPLDWLGGAPAARYWLHCERTAAIAGSVVIAGDASARSRTEEALRAFLPGDWEIVVGDAAGECAQWNRAIANARGDILWFLRAGMQPTEKAFHALRTRCGAGPVAAASAGVPDVAGDIAGMMIPRLDVLFVGPLPEWIRNTRVALEEYSMRIGSKLPAVCHVEARLPVVQAPIEHPQEFEAESAELLRRWSLLDPVEARDSADSARPTVRVSWSGRKPRISLCMIARDEERFLEQCLTSAADAFDEIVLVDTGSTDRTVEIARSFGAKVLHRPWDDDFASPRNVAMGEATGDWILVLDADEVVQAGGCERIRELVQNPAALGYHLHFINDFGEGKTVGVMMVRLFRNLPGICYENVIHEQVTPSLQRIGGELGLTLLSADVEVLHHGYTAELMDDRSKIERNERLFIKQLEQSPDDIYCHYKYGDFLRRVPGRSVDARALLDRCLELIEQGSPALPRALPYASEVAALCALEASRAGDRDRACEVVEIGLRRFVPTPNLHYLAASLALGAGEADVAMHHYRRCLAYRGQVLVVPIQEGITSYVSLVGIAQAWILRGSYKRAQQLLDQAIAIQSDYEVAHLALSKLWLAQGDCGRALSVLTEYLTQVPDSPGACQQTMLILQRLGRVDAAREMGEHTVRRLRARALDREAAAVDDILATL